MKVFLLTRELVPYRTQRAKPVGIPLGYLLLSKILGGL